MRSKEARSTREKQRVCANPECRKTKALGGWIIKDGDTPYCSIVCANKHPDPDPEPISVIDL